MCGCTNFIGADERHSCTFGIQVSMEIEFCATLKLHSTLRKDAHNVMKLGLHAEKQTVKFHRGYARRFKVGRFSRRVVAQPSDWVFFIIKIDRITDLLTS